MTIFADSSAIVSLYSKTDPNHIKARQLIKTYAQHKLIISKYIFAEVVTVMSQREGRNQAIKVGETLKNSYNWVEINQDMENLAWQIFKRQKSKNVSFVDCTIFALYKQGVFDEAFSFDQDFESNNIPVIS